MTILEYCKKNNHLSILSILLVCLNTFILKAQTVLINPAGDGGFENGSTFAANGWSVSSGTNNPWFTGVPGGGTDPASPMAGNKAFISNDGGATRGYSTTAPCQNYFWRDVTVPVGQTKLILTFNWEQQGQSSNDIVQVFFAPTSITPAGSNVFPGTGISNIPTTITGATYLANTFPQTGVQTITTTLPATLAGTTFRLIFLWKSDASTGTQPSVAIDNISLTSDLPSIYTWVPTTGSAAWNAAASWNPERTSPNISDTLNFSNGGNSIVTIASGSIGGNLVLKNNTITNFQASATNTLSLRSLNIENGSSLFLNGTTAQTLAFSSGAVNTIGGRLEIANTSGLNTLNVTNSVTTVTNTGVLAAGTTVVGSPWSGAANTTLIINGTYEHKYTITTGTIPTAAWGSNSNCNIIGYTSSTSGPTGINQNFGNFTWNCPNQTSNLNLSSSSITGISGTLTLASTGTGECRWTGTGGYTINANNFSQTGGTFDLASGSTSSIITFNVSGSFNQTAGIFRCSGTGSTNPTLHFNGGFAQTVSFSTQPTGPITYRFSNPSGVTIHSDFASTFNIGNGTNGGVRISTAVASPVTFSGTLTGFSYNQTNNNSTLIYDATGNITANELIYPGTNSPTRLNVNIGTGNVLTLPFSRTIPGTLTMTSGDLDISSHSLTIGTSATSPGTLTYASSSGFIRLTSGSLTRWFPVTGLPTFPGPSGGIGIFPVASGENNRRADIFFNSSTALSAGGTLTISHNAVGGVSEIMPSILDGSYEITKRTNSSWVITTGNGITTSGSGTLSMRLTAGNALASPTPTNLRIIQSASVAGSHDPGGGQNPNFLVARLGLSLSQINNTHYIGAGTSDIFSVFTSVASGDWNNATTWDLNSIPDCNNNTVILNNHNVTINSSGNSCRNIIINAGGTLSVASGNLTMGCTLNNNSFINSGILSVSGGALNINGSMLHNAGSTFNQSGGEIFVDGNDNGNTINSVSNGTAIVQLNSPNINWTGGRLTIVDPHAASSANTTFMHANPTNHVNILSGHTIRFGDGVSTDPGGNATNGFRLNTVGNSNHISFFNFEVAGGTGTNRFVSSASEFGINGNLTINPGGEFRPGNISTTVSGNIVNNGIITAVNSIALGSYKSGVVDFSSDLQSISGSGIFRDAVTNSTLSMNSLVVRNNNPAGVTLNVPLSVSSLNLFGILNTTATNFIRLGSETTSGSLSGNPGANAYVNGPLLRTFTANRTASGTYNSTTLFAVGKTSNGSYLPIHVDPSTRSTGPITVRCEAFTSNTGSQGVNVTSLSDNRWEAMITSGQSNFISTNIRLNDGSIVSTNKILQASSSAGTYNGAPVVSTFASGTPNTLTTTETQIPAAEYTGFFAYGNLVNCTEPENQPTAFQASFITTTTFTGSFTPAAGNPSHFLVVRYPSGSTPTHPENFTSYTLNAILGDGRVRGILKAPVTSFNETSLTSATAYDYYVYSYNNIGCIGPVYNSVNPLLATVTTCTTALGVPGTPTASSITNNSFTVSWTASSTPDVNYFVDVATNNTFTNLVSGYNGLNVGMVLTTNITGLSGNTPYFVRVRSELNNCFSFTSGTLTITTLCDPSPLPVSQGFENAGLPVCWGQGMVSGTNQWQNVTFSNNIAGPYAGSRFMTKTFDPSDALLYSLPLNYSGVTNPTQVSVYLHRHASAHTSDEYRIHVNTTRSLTGATQILSLFSRTSIAPEVPSTGWYNYIADIPVSYHGLPEVYIIVQGITTSFSSSFVLGMDEFKVEFAAPDAVDFGNLQSVSLSTMQPCQTVDVYAQAYEPGVTEAPGQGVGLTAWIGRHTANTNPATWPESAWTVAPYFGQAGPNNNNDEFKLSYTNLVPGTYYIASRFRLNSGPYSYGADNNGFWNGSTNNNWVLTVAMPAFTPTATPSAICLGQSSNLDVTTSYNNYAYLWNPGSLSGKMQNVSPTTTTTYIVTVTDTNTNCTGTSSVTVIVSPPLAISSTTAIPSSFCGAGNSQLSVSTNRASNSYLFSASAGSFIPLSGATRVNSIENDEAIASVPIGFPFIFAENTYTNVYASSNGFLSFNPSAFSGLGNNITSPNSALVPLLAPLWDDLDGRAAGGVSQASYLTQGIAPNRIFTFEWLNWEWDFNANQAVISFQVKLYESDNRIEFIYRQEPASVTTPSGGASIGITSSAGNFLSLNNSGSNPSASSVTGTNNITSKPSTGQIYTFMPPPLNYLWSPNQNPLSAIDVRSPLAQNLTSTTAFTVTVTDQFNCSATGSVTVTLSPPIVTNTGDSGQGTLRDILNCVQDGGIITYDQPATTTTLLTTPLTIDKNVTIMGLNDTSRPEITVPAAGIMINSNKMLTLKDVDIKSGSPSSTFSGSGELRISGLSIVKQ